MVDVHPVGMVGDLDDVFAAEVAAALELPGVIPWFVLGVSGGHLGLDVGPRAGTLREAGWSHG